MSPTGEPPPSFDANAPVDLQVGPCPSVYASFGFFLARMRAGRFLVGACLGMVLLLGGRCSDVGDHGWALAKGSALGPGVSHVTVFSASFFLSNSVRAQEPELFYIQPRSTDISQPYFQLAFNTAKSIPHNADMANIFALNFQVVISTTPTGSMVNSTRFIDFGVNINNNCQLGVCIFAVNGRFLPLMGDRS